MRHSRIYIFLLIGWITSATFAQTTKPLDSILCRTMDAAQKYDRMIERYQATLYMRTYAETQKKNWLSPYIHRIPNSILHDPKNTAAVIETIGKIRYTYPNKYIQDIKHVSGTLTKKREINKIPFHLLNINVYSETSLDEMLIMPLRYSSAKYYTYELEKEFLADNGMTYYTYSYQPKYVTPRLLKGTFIIENGSWRVIQFHGEGVDVLDNFSFTLTMGEQWISRYLPTDYVIYRASSYFGNLVSNRYRAHITYDNFELRETFKKEENLNISDLYQIKMDSVPVKNDTLFWMQSRPVPLQEKEKDVLRDYYKKQKISAVVPLDSVNTWKYAQQMVINTNYTYKSTKINYSGLLNPSMFGYSTYDGITYGQRASFSFGLLHPQDFLIDAFLGYMFQRKELFSDITLKWIYNPQRMGNLVLSLGNGNPTYSSMFTQQVQDSLATKGLDFEDIAVNYYRDYYLKFFNELEYTNGLRLGLGANYHIRQGKNKIPPQVRATQDDLDGVDKLFGTKYTFEAFIRAIYTPGQYYRFAGNRKIPVRSYYPTFKVEIAKGVKNILQSASSYSRLELDISQRIPIGVVRSLQYHIGGGLFSNFGTEYFADFIFFSKNNFPENWEDGIGGNFNLLRRNFYNASESYMQAHLMYETPFLFLKKIPIVSKGVAKERIYVSQLHTPQIISYTELGYGVGNRIFNVGIFSSFYRFNFVEMGVKVALSL